MTPAEDLRFDWRRGGAAAIALIATLVLLGMVVLVAMTGYGQESDRRRTRAAGFQHHLVKPVDITVLEALLA